MSFINVAEWTPKHVVQWLQGKSKFKTTDYRQIKKIRIRLAHYNEL